MSNEKTAKPVVQKASRRKRRSSAEIMARLLSAAAEEFTSCGFAGATTAGIASRADVTEAQLFRYFDSKAAIFQASIFEPLCRELEKFNDQHLGNVDAGDNIRHRESYYILALQKFISDHAGMFLSLIVAEAYAEKSACGVAEVVGLRTYFERGAETMKSRVGGDTAVPPELMVRVSFAAVLASVLFKDWIFPAELASENQISDAVVNFVIDGISGDGRQ